MYVVSYEIIGDADASETGTASAFELPGSSSSSSEGADAKTMVPTVRSLREGFPYEGRFHFRAKVPCPGLGTGAGPEDYAWLDLTDADAPLPVWREEAGTGACEVHVRVLPLSLPPLTAPDAAGDSAVEAALAAEGETLDYSGGDLDDDIMEASYGSGGGGPRAGFGGEEGEDGSGSGSYRRRHHSSGGGGGGGGVGGMWSQSLKEATETVLTSEITRDVTKLGKQVGKQVGKGINSLFKAVLSHAAGGEGGSAGYPSTAPTGPSPAAIKTLRALEEAVARTPSADLLAALWLALFPDPAAAQGQAFAARSPQWRAAGFAGEDPLQDLRGTGTLCVQCILHFARQHPARLRAILREQAPRDQAHYPFAAVANSLTLMLIEAFKLRDGRYLHVQAGFWGLFEGSRGASAVEEAFGPCLAFLDRRWAETGATREQFPSLIRDTKMRLENALGQGPASLADLARLAEANGLYVD